MLTYTDNFISAVLHVIHMKKDITTVRDVDEETLKKFKARAIEEGMKMGKALTEAMEKWLKEKDKTDLDPKQLLRIKPFDWGAGTERTSKEIDEILYGSRK